MTPSIPTSPPPISAPPTSPDVAQQQGPISQFLQGQGGDQQVQNFSPLALAEQRLNQVALAMRDVAKVLVNIKPELMPVWEKMMQAGTMLLGEIQKSSQGQGPQGPPAGAPPDQDTGADQGQPQVG